MKNQINNFSIRDVKFDDKKLLFDWVNDIEARKWSFSQKKIKISEHDIWFHLNINNPDCLILIFEVNLIPAGYVRFERNAELVLNYLICNEYRGKSLATKMLKMALSRIPRNWKEEEVFAYTKSKNIASNKSLTNAGFNLKSKQKDKNIYVLHI